MKSDIIVVAFSLVEQQSSGCCCLTPLQTAVTIILCTLVLGKLHPAETKLLLWADFHSAASVVMIIKQDLEHPHCFLYIETNFWLQFLQNSLNVFSHRSYCTLALVLACFLCGSMSSAGCSVGRIKQVDTLSWPEKNGPLPPANNLFMFDEGSFWSVWAITAFVQRRRADSGKSSRKW